jgi:squalene synthase HpnC
MKSFLRELARFGPHSNGPILPLERARSYCARFTRSHYENFTVASTLLPRRLVPHFFPVYAWCRWADDLADETEPAAAPGLLAWWRAELLACYDGKARHPITIALRPTIRRFHIPPTPFLELLAAFEQDQRVKRYATFAELLQYCRHSANPVGHLVLHICESYSAENASLADHICTGLQLANFWQDVARDLTQLGRVYLPEEDRRRFGYSDDDLIARRFTPAFAELLRFEVERTRAIFERGRPLLYRLPGVVRIDIDLFLRSGLAILDKIESIGFNVWATRPVLSKWEKAGLLLRAVLQRLRV